MKKQQGEKKRRRISDERARRRDLHPCSAATLNSSSGIASANFLASLASVALSRGGDECLYAAISSSTDGGAYEEADLKSSLASLGISTRSGEGGMGLLEDAVAGRDTFDSAGDVIDDGMEKSEEVEAPDEDCVDGDGGEGMSIPSSSASRSTLSSSADGKKFLKRSSACHFDAFLNSIQTSIRPGRERAGSRRSRWLVVL